MSLLSGFDVSLSLVRLLGKACQAAHGALPPAGWTIYQTFDDPWTGANATVLTDGSRYILAFRGTDEAADVNNYPLLASGQYIHLFDSLLNALPAGVQYFVTGASLGGGAANLLASIADTAYGGKFANATFVAFASPNISHANGILNIGFENDPVYKLIGSYTDQASSLDNLVLATADYMAGNYDGRHPFDDGAHSSGLGFAAFDRLAQSAYFNVMQPDSVVIFAATDGKVQDLGPGRSLTGAFYIGRSTADFMVGRSGNDHLEGFGGNDTLRGSAGADYLAGDAGADLLVGGSGRDRFLFDTRLGSTNVDTIQDFQPVDDWIHLDDAIFTRVGPVGRLAVEALCKGPAARDASDRIIYDGATGALFYDPDGTGAAPAVKFAQIGAGLHIMASDFVIV